MPGKHGYKVLSAHSFSPDHPKINYKRVDGRFVMKNNRI